jgi:hypothetical protein
MRHCGRRASWRTRDGYAVLAAPDPAAASDRISSEQRKRIGCYLRRAAPEQAILNKRFAPGVQLNEGIEAVAAGAAGLDEMDICQGIQQGKGNVLGDIEQRRDSGNRDLKAFLRGSLPEREGASLDLACLTCWPYLFGWW